MAAAGDRGANGGEEIAYWECRRNHAAPIGRYAVDGCCEFLKGREGDSLEALLCGACGCHRSFHRKGGPPPYSRRLTAQREGNNDPIDCFGGGGAAATDDGGEMDEEATSRIRGGTQLTREQKSRLMRFADRLGWRIHRHHDHEEIFQFCSEMGMSTAAFKAWLSNNRRRRRGDTDKDA